MEHSTLTREDPIVLAWFERNLPWLERMTYKMNGPFDGAYVGLGITPQDLASFRDQMPLLLNLVRGALAEPDHVDTKDSSVLKRILAKIAPEWEGCARWLGATQGGPRGRGTPVISYHGKITPARRLMWQLRYRGTDQELMPDERLSGSGCREASLCMNLAHWRKKLHKPGRTELELAAGTRAASIALCPANRHLMSPRLSTASDRMKECLECRREQAHTRDVTQDAAFKLGQAIRRSIRLSAAHAEP